MAFLFQRDKNKTKYVIGYDLNDQMSQISYFELDQEVPLTLRREGDEHRLGIPTLLCKRKNVSQWFYGNDAEVISARGDGTRVAKLLSFARAGARIELEGEAYDCIDLLVLFVVRSLNLLSDFSKPEEVEAIYFTVDSLEGRTVEILERIADAIPIPRERVFFQNYSESTFYYLLHQPKEIWEHDVAVFDYSGNNLHGLVLRMNKHTTPAVGFVDEFAFEDVLMPEVMMKGEMSREKAERLDENVLRHVHEFFIDRTVGTVFLIGEGFDGDWCDKTIKYMCMGKRVYHGKNLYSKGACYCAKDKIMPSYLNKEYVFLGKDKLKFNLGMHMMHCGKEEYVAIADGGDNWYEAGMEVELILEKGNEIPMVITPLDGKNPEVITITLKGLPDRPNRATRIRLKVNCTSETAVTVSAEDLGFGDLFPATHMVWDRTIEIK